jgi:hypothetical protein
VVDTAPVPDWPTCGESNCAGVRIGGGGSCLAHAGRSDRERFLGELGPGADVDLRGTDLGDERLAGLLAAVRDAHGPRFGRARFDGARFSGQAAFDGLRGHPLFDGDVSFAGARFGTDDRAAPGVRFDGTFGGRAVFDGARFAAPVVFCAVFLGDAGFVGTRFGGETRFTETEFTGDASFAGATFAGVACFNCRFGATVRFASDSRAGEPAGSGATFRDAVSFSGVRFDGSAVFGGVSVLGSRSARQRLTPTRRVRAGDALSAGATFDGRVSFDGSTFGGEANFRGLAYPEGVGFADAIFTADAFFTDSVFTGPARFGGARFTGNAHFVRATFADGPDFVDAHFGRRAGFGRTVWPAGATLGPCTATELVLDGSRGESVLRVRCHGVRRLEASDLEFPELDLRLDGTVTVDAAGVRPLGALSLVHRDGGLTIGGAAFATPATISGPTGVGVDPPTPGTGTSGVGGDGRADGGTGAGAGVEPRLLALSGVDATNLTLARLDLRAARVVDCHHRDRLRIDGPARFHHPPPRRLWARRRVLAEEHLWRARYDRRPAGWFPDACRHPDEPHPERGPADEDARHEAARLQAVYRDLRKGREDAKDEPGAADFYYGEMEMRRLAATPHSIERAVLTTYWLISGYGLRATRALAALLLLLVLGSVGFATVGFGPSGQTRFEPVATSTPDRPATYRQMTVPGPKPGVGAAIDHSVDSATSLLRAGTPRPLTPAGRALEIALRLLGPLLLGLAVLALRGRVKR